MKKYFIFVIAIVALVVMASGCTSQNGNTTTSKAYSANGISFNYPSDWSVINQTSSQNLTGVILGDVTYNQSNGTNGNGLIILKIPQTTNTSSEVSNIKKQFTNGTNSTIIISGVNANLTALNASANNITAQFKFVDFSKNNSTYLLQYTTVSNGTVTPGTIFDNIIKSFQVT